MPLNQVATVSAPEPRMLSVQVWDKRNVGPVEKAIRSAGLGLNPIIDGQTLRLPIPDLTEERRKELAKLAGQYAEKARIAARNVRRDGMDTLKTDEKKGDISRGRAQAPRDRGAEADRQHDRRDRRRGAAPRKRKSWASDARRRQPMIGAGRARRRALPRHVAIIMDGNGRWAKKRQLPRVAGHGGRRGGAQGRPRGARDGHRGADALRLLVGELAAARGGSRRPDGAAAAFHPQRPRRTGRDERPAARDRRLSRASRPIWSR